MSLKTMPTRQRVVVYIASALFAVVAISSLNWLLFGRWHENTNNAYVRADISIVSAKIEGYVRDVVAKDNETVKAGDPLVIIDPSDYESAVAHAKANLARAEAEYSAAQAGARVAGGQLGQQGDQIAQARAKLAAAQADQARLAADEVRYKELAAKGFVSDARLQTIKAEAAQARAMEAAARADLGWQQGQSGVLSSQRSRAGGDVDAAKAAVEAAQADLVAAQLNLDRTVIRAPVDGVVGNRVAQPGQLVRPGVQLLSVVPLSDVYIVANFKETQLEKVRPGQPVKLKVDAYPHLKVSGVVDSVAPASGAQFSILPTDTATGNFTKIVQRIPIKVRVRMSDEARGLLRPGMSVTATVDTHPLKQKS